MRVRVRIRLSDRVRVRVRAKVTVTVTESVKKFPVNESVRISNILLYVVFKVEKSRR